jgi:predicted small integral membrane protein
MRVNRVTKLLLVAGVAFYLTLIGYNNLADYPTNLVFVQHVLAMDTLAADTPLRGRAVTRAQLQHALYWGIIAWELVAAVWCWYGVGRLGWAFRGDNASFQRAKAAAVGGLTAGLLLWLVAFLGVGGEWFVMWLSPSWNGQNAAFRMFAVTGIVLLYVNQPD